VSHSQGSGMEDAEAIFPELCRKHVSHSKKTKEVACLMRACAAVIDQHCRRSLGAKVGSISLKVHKNENFFGFDFEICTFS
jgi:hypothetical protein